MFKRIGLGSVLGYLAAGLAIGPFGLRWFSDPAAILHVAELGVVMFLFVIGLEMRPSHLWRMRNDIFGVGSLQILTCSALLTCIGLLFGFSLPVSFVCGTGFVMTSTAIVMQVLGERGDLAAPRGQKMVAILLFEDLLIVPLLALVTFMAPAGTEHALAAGERWQAVGVAALAVAALVIAGRWLLNPLFRLLAKVQAREVMTAAALLVVLGAALLMQVSGLSMAMGAFLAGVLLSESTFRHQLEADVEPFRGLLLGLFFLAVGMSLDLAVVAANWPLIVSGVLALMATKALSVYVIARFMRSSHGDALDRAVLMAQGGEFAFVLFAAAAANGVINAQVNANMTAIVVLSMVLTPLVVIVHRRFAPRRDDTVPDGVEGPSDLGASVIIIGFGRFGQIASQHVLAIGAQVSIIDRDPDLAPHAEKFGFKVYFGDGTRMDILHAAGAHHAQAVMVCVDDQKAATRIAETVRDHFPQAQVLVRARDREHAMQLMNANVDYQIRETFESAMRFGQAATEALGQSPEAAQAVADDLRRRDAERFTLEVVGGLSAGVSQLIGNINRTA